MKIKKLFLGVFAAIGLAAVLGGACSSIAPGSDPTEVRAEQTVAMASDTFDVFLQLDYNNVDLIRSNAPAVHAFAEYLRQPVKVNGVTYPRDIAFIESANTVRLSYKANRSADNKANLVTAMATLEAVLNQTEQQLAVANAIKPTPIPGPPAQAPAAAAVFSPIK